MLLNSAVEANAIIRIDRSTFRRNPNAFNTASIVQGPSSCSVVIRDGSGRYVFEQCADGFLLVSSHLVGDPLVAVGQSVADPTSLFPDGIVSVYNHTGSHLAYHMPEPEWLFQYEPTEVTCRKCGEAFPNQELGSDYVIGEDDEIGSSACCPKCGAWECCSVEYERPEGVAEELAIAMKE